MMPKHLRARPAHNLLHLFPFGRLIAVDRALAAGGFVFTKDAFIKALHGIVIQRLIMGGLRQRLRAFALIQRNHFLDSELFTIEARTHDVLLSVAAFGLHHLAKPFAIQLGIRGGEKVDVEIGVRR